MSTASRTGGRSVSTASRTGRWTQLFATALAVAGWLCACGGARGAGKPPSFGWVDGSNPRGVGPRAPRVHWTLELTRHFEGRYVPVETAGAAIDPVTGITYVGSSRGTLLALGPEGKQLYTHDAGDAIDGPPALDTEAGELYLVNARGVLHALNAASGELRFEAEVGASVSAPMQLTHDALYLVTDTDVVMAISRNDGAVLWRYRRDQVGGIAIAGHAGLLLTDRKLVTGFSDGAVVALDAADGSVVWELDTTLDLEAPQDMGVFVDADATPVRAGDTVYVASVAAGVYALDVHTGSLQRRFAELTGVTGFAADDHSLLVASSDLGLLCLDLSDYAPRWRRKPGHGAVGPPQIVDGAAYVSESTGALLAVALDDGSEVGRLQSAHGFSGTATLRDGLGAIVSNAGRLYAFTY